MEKYIFIGVAIPILILLSYGVTIEILELIEEKKGYRNEENVDNSLSKEEAFKLVARIFVGNGAHGVSLR